MQTEATAASGDSWVLVGRRRTLPTYPLTPLHLTPGACMTKNRINCFKMSVENYSHEKHGNYLLNQSYMERQAIGYTTWSLRKQQVQS